MAAKKRARSAADRAADKKRAAGVRRAWEQAREYAKRHGTKPTLAKRIVPFSLTNASIREGTRKAFVQKKRLKGGKRGSEKWRIQKGGVEFRLIIRRADGGMLIGKDGAPIKEVRSDPLRLGGGATVAQVQKAMRNAAFGVMGADLQYERGLGEVEIDDGGDIYLANHELDLLLEPYEPGAGERFIEYADDDDAE